MKKGEALDPALLKIGYMGLLEQVPGLRNRLHVDSATALVEKDFAIGQRFGPFQLLDLVLVRVVVHLVK